MSLFTGLLRDALLETVMQQDVYINRRTDSVKGAGTFDDPYNSLVLTGGSDDPAASAAKLDAVLSSLPAGATIRFGPGAFYTAGSAAWQPQSGMRLIGSGVGITTVKLVGIATGTVISAVGGSSDLNGFEASDFTIDANLSGNTNSGVGALGIAVKGNHILLRRIQVINFGSKASSTYTVINAAQNGSYDCVVEDCLVEQPDSNDTGSGNGILFGFTGASGDPHRFCVIRNCSGRAIAISNTVPPPAITSDKYHAVSPGVGVGTIIEGNSFANLGTAIFATEQPTVDLIVRQNYFMNVWKGIRWDQLTGTVGRLVILGNTVELATASGTLSGATGIQTIAASANLHKLVIIRGNTVRDVQAISGISSPAITGISVSGCTNLLVENNLINNTDTTTGVIFSNCGTTKFFSNQNSAGQLMRGYSSSKYTQELEDEAENVFLCI